MLIGRYIGGCVRWIHRWMCAHRWIHKWMCNAVCV